jgi:glycosyltransferase involved in cell wall biosynthesis
MVFVDDGSSDQTFDPIVESASVDPRIVGARLSRNFGHHAALETLTEDIVVVMAGDLQDRPEEIPDFMAEHAGGYDVVYAQRVRRRGSLLSCTAFFFYRPMKRMSGVDVPVDSGDFALLPRRVVDQVNRLPKRHRYLRGLPAWVGSPQTEIVVERDPRAGGDASYTLRRLVRLALDGVFALSVTPLRAAWLLGACVSAAASFYAVWVIFERLFIGGAPRGFTALIVAITFVAGVQLLFLGLISEYFGRVVDEAKGRPHVVVTDVARGDRRKAAGRRDAPILTGLAS